MSCSIAHAVEFEDDVVHLQVGPFGRRIVAADTRMTRDADQPAQAQLAARC